MLSKASKGVWCDYCKNRYGIHNPKGNTPAAWTVHSELPKSNKGKRSYCNPCATDVSTWADGTYFALDQQIEYAKSNGNLIQGELK